jgi:hypothetical protein
MNQELLLYSTLHHRSSIVNTVVCVCGIDHRGKTIVTDTVSSAEFSVSEMTGKKQ